MEKFNKYSIQSGLHIPNKSIKAGAMVRCSDNSGQVRIGKGGNLESCADLTFIKRPVEVLTVECSLPSCTYSTLGERFNDTIVRDNVSGVVYFTNSNFLRPEVCPCCKRSY